MSYTFPYIVWLYPTKHVTVNSSDLPITFDDYPITGTAQSLSALVSVTDVSARGIATACASELTSYLNIFFADQLTQLNLTSNNFLSGSAPTVHTNNVVNGLTAAINAARNSDDFSVRLADSLSGLSEITTFNMVLRTNVKTQFTPTVAATVTQDASGNLFMNTPIGQTITMTSPVRTLLVQIMSA